MKLQTIYLKQSFTIIVWAIVVENKLKIGAIVVVAFVAGIIGTLSFTSFDNMEITADSDVSPFDESLSIGAYVTVEAYHADGTLYHSWDGHNLLGQAYQNALVGCISGLDTTPSHQITCTKFFDTLALTLRNQSSNAVVPLGAINTLTPSVAGLPENCIFDHGGQDRCTGWQLEGTFDFAGLDCDAGVNCFNATNTYSSINATNAYFNTITLDEQIPIGPDDRLIVTMDFSIPL